MSKLANKEDDFHNLIFDIDKEYLCDISKSLCCRFCLYIQDIEERGCLMLITESAQEVKKLRNFKRKEIHYGI